MTSNNDMANRARHAVSRLSATVGLFELCICSIVFASLASVPFPALAQTSEWIGFETTDQSALPIIRASLNGSEGHRLVMDVSFLDNVLDNTIVAGSGMELASRNEEKTIDYYGRSESVPVAYLTRLSIGDVLFQTVPVLIVEGDDSTVLGGIRSYGRIGRETIKQLRLTIHYPRRLMLFDASPEDIIPPNGESFDAEKRFIELQVSIATPEGVREIPFVYDAGSSTTVLDRRWAAKTGLSKRSSASATLDSLRVGNVHKKEFRIALGDMRELPYPGDPLGIIGTDLIRELSVTFDFPRSMIWLQPIDDDENEELGLKPGEKKPGNSL